MKLRPAIMLLALQEFDGIILSWDWMSTDTKECRFNDLLYRKPDEVTKFLEDLFDRNPTMKSMQIKYEMQK
jgi:hypothetical protein